MLAGTVIKKSCSSIGPILEGRAYYALRKLCEFLVPSDWVRTRAVRRRHCVGGAPVNIGRRRHAAGPKTLAAAAQRGWPKTFFSKIHEKISFYPQNFLRNFFSHQ